MWVEFSVVNFQLYQHIRKWNVNLIRGSHTVLEVSIKLSFVYDSVNNENRRWQSETWARVSVELALNSSNAIFLFQKPGTNSNLPVLINIHGGTFIRGSASRQSNYAQYVLEHDVVVATINYRLGPFGNYWIGIELS